MPIAIAFVALIIVVSAVRGTYGDLFKQLTTDLVTGSAGKPPFVVWLGAILLIGMLGYIPNAQTPSRYLLALVFLVLVLKNGGAFTNFVAAVKSPAAPASSQPVAPSPLGPLPVSFGNNAPGGNVGQTVGSAAAAAAGGF